jgi:hypothetical protein
MCSAIFKTENRVILEIRISGISYFSILKRIKHARKIPETVMETRLKIHVGFDL